MRDWDIAVLVATAALGLIAIVGVIEVMRRARGQQRLRETLARVLHDMEPPKGSGSRAEGPGDADETDGDRGPERRS